MKLLNILKEIEENEIIKDDTLSIVDEVGKFFVVKKPKSKMTKEEMVYEATVFDEINKEEIRGIYKNKSEANRHATEVLKEYEAQLKEMEDAMESFRTTKNDIEEKKKIAREKIMRLK
jgi:hypothetical protein